VSPNEIKIFAATAPQFYRVITFDDLVIENGDIVIKFTDVLTGAFTGLSHNHNALCCSSPVVQRILKVTTVVLFGQNTQNGAAR